MILNRRQFITTSGLATGLSWLSCKNKNRSAAYEQIDAALNRPVFKKQLFKTPVIIESVELLRYKQNFICRVRSTEGAEGYSVSNNMRMKFLYPIQVMNVNPFFLGKDARNLDSLIEGVYLYQSNYKYQGYALWIPVATVEFAILDMMGKIAKKPMGALFGDIYHKKIAVYQANNHRGKSAEESLEMIKQTVTASGARALKFKIGGRMRKNREVPAGRTEKLIPMIREAFGDDMTIYADSNGSYTTGEAIRIGRILEKHQIDFYEEPVPFDWYHETKQVADVLSIPIAGGEQEPSLHNFRWLIGNHALQIVQPDMFYFGGMIRSARVARMAEVNHLTCTPHISGSGTGYVYMMHFVSTIKNAGPYHEFKGLSRDIPLECPTSSLQVENGKVQVPSGPGLGIEIDPDFIQKHKPVNL